MIEKIDRKISKRGYVYIGRAYSGQTVTVKIKPEMPEITAELKPKK